MIAMTLEDLGYLNEFEEYRRKNGLDAFGVGRVISEHRERYVVKTAEQEYEAEIIGQLRFASQSRTDFPAVGDWVATSAYEEDKVLIHAVFPRKTCIERQAVGTRGEKQIIAANVDYAFIVQSADRDFSLNRLERYLTLCNASKVSPVVVINKTDLVDAGQVQSMIAEIQSRVKGVDVIPISARTQMGTDRLKNTLKKGKTYCLLGSSGVGKSSLVNVLSGKQAMTTNPISSSTRKGRHVTSHRELFVLDHGGIIIDNPGMREVGMADSAGGLEKTFEALLSLSGDCKYKDCTHTAENGCAVLAALERGDIDRDSYENYLKMQRENEYFTSTVAERRQKDKDLGKIIKHFHKSNKFRRQ